MKPRSITLTFLISALVVSLLLVCRLMWPFLQPICFAVILGVSLYPLHRRVLARLQRPNWAALASTLAVFLLVLIPVTAIAYVVSTEMVQAGEYLAAQNHTPGGFAPATEHLVAEVMQPFGDLGMAGAARLKYFIEGLPRQASAYLLGAGTVLVGSLAGIAGKTIITFFVLFFLFRDGEQVSFILAFALPLSERHSQRLFGEIRRSIVANLYAMVAVAVVQAVLSALGYLALGLPSSPMLAALTGIGSLVPVVGTAIVWVPIALYLLAKGYVLKSILLLLWGTIVIAGSDNLVRARILQGDVGMHPLLLILSVLGGIEVFGFLGIFIGPLMLSVTVALIDMLRDEIIAGKMAKAVGG
ncbi:MAG: AI-2E family transporter [Acidobacteriaceae bacterium]